MDALGSFGDSEALLLGELKYSLDCGVNLFPRDCIYFADYVHHSTFVYRAHVEYERNGLILKPILLLGQYCKRIWETERFNGTRERNNDHDTRQFSSRYSDSRSYAALFATRTYSEVNNKYVTFVYRTHSAYARDLSNVAKSAALASSHIRKSFFKSIFFLIAAR